MSLFDRIKCALVALLFIAGFTLGLLAEEPPAWLMRGLLAVETNSRLRADGSAEYRNQQRGTAGEVGITQALPSTLRQHGFSPSLFEQSPSYALAATARILRRYKEQTGSWDGACAAWHRGLAGRGKPSAIRYALRVRATGGAR